ncbi:MAG: hypothetical protein Q4B26_01585 [Eubacteriales bacterium]|nr:hypothetical protein [Eubacteriales bacterium]
MLMIFSPVNDDGDMEKPMDLFADTKEQAMRTVQKLADIHQRKYDYELFEVTESQVTRRSMDTDAPWVHLYVWDWYIDRPIGKGIIYPRTMK